MQIGDHPIGVCSWSIRHAGMAPLVRAVRELGLSHVQLALSELLELDAPQRQREIDVFRDSGMVLTAGMIRFPGEDYSSIAMIRQTGGFVPDALWPGRRATAVAAAQLGRQMGTDRVSAHVGFVPPSSDGRYGVMIERVREVADAFGQLEAELLMETGQERAPELLQFLNDLARRNVHVNFDPANMILYGAGEPIEAIRVLGRHVAHVHVKDAVLSDKPGTVWGQEAAFGNGQVGAERLIDALHAIDYRGPLVIEREAGADVLADVRRAIQVLRAAAGESNPAVA